MKKIFSVYFDRISAFMLVALLIEEPLMYTVVLLFSALVHECGHILAAHVLNISIEALHISILGARLKLSDPLLSYEKEWWLCAFGPLFSFLLAAFALFLHGIYQNEEFFRLLSITSYALGMINLLPIGWLDGGRMFRALCLTIFSHRTANALLQCFSLIFLLLLWMTSVYLLIRVGNSLKLFIFSFSLFFRFFYPKCSIKN